MSSSLQGAVISVNTIKSIAIIVLQLCHANTAIECTIIVLDTFKYSFVGGTLFIGKINLRIIKKLMIENAKICLIVLFVKYLLRWCVPNLHWSVWGSILFCIYEYMIVYLSNCYYVIFEEFYRFFVPVVIFKQIDYILEEH